MDCTLNLYKETNTIKLYLVKFKNLKYIFWLPKTNLSSKVVNVYFDNDINTIESGTIGISLKGLTDIEDLKTALEIFLHIMKEYLGNNIKFKLIYHNGKQQMLSTVLEQMLDVSSIFKEDEINTNNNIFNQNKESDKTFSVINGRIFDNDTFIGIVGQDGYTVDINTNAIYRNNKFIAWIGDSNKNQGNSKGTTRNLAPSYLKNTRPSNVSTEPSGPINISKGKSAAFVDIPIIMFILSSLLLIGTIILLFILQ